MFYSLVYKLRQLLCIVENFTKIRKIVQQKITQKKLLFRKSESIFIRNPNHSGIQIPTYIFQG